MPAASRSIILQKTRDLREASQDSNFRDFRKKVEIKREKELEWNEKQKEKFKTDVEKKQEVALGQERKRLTMLEELKSVGGPFTNAEEVELYMASPVPDGVKQKRMKKEIQFARESSTTLPKVDPLFKIQVTQAGQLKKRRDKTAQEFADSLMCYLGKKADRTVMEYSSFQQGLRTIAIPK